jgi:hypothetical protein
VIGDPSSSIPPSKLYRCGSDVTTRTPQTHLPRYCSRRAASLASLARSGHRFPDRYAGGSRQTLRRQAALEPGIAQLQAGRGRRDAEPWRRGQKTSGFAAPGPCLRRAAGSAGARDGARPAPGLGRALQEERRRGGLAQQGSGRARWRRADRGKKLSLLIWPWKTGAQSPTPFKHD